MSESPAGHDQLGLPSVADVLDALGALRRRVEQQATLIADQQHQIAEQQRQIDGLSTLGAATTMRAGDPIEPFPVRTQGSSSDAAATASEPTAAVAKTLGRRSMLRLAGATAAGAAVAGAAVVSSATPAAAATGNNLVLGVTNYLENSTQIHYDGSGALATSIVAAADSADFTTAFPSALAGFANGTNIDHGVYGWSQAAGYGVVARGVNTAAGGLFAQGAAGIDAIYAASTGTGNAIHATADGSGMAVNANNPVGVALAGSGLIGVTSAAAGVNLRTYGVGLVPSQRTNEQLAGDLASDVNKDLWYAVTDGAPGVWRKLAGPNTAGSLTILGSTARIYDSRPGLNPTGVTKGRFADHEERVIDPTIGTGVPFGATAVLINATATNTNPGGFFAFFKNGTAWPNNSSLNWATSNTTVANMAIVAVDGASKFRARCEGAGGADLVIDCIGFFQ